MYLGISALVSGTFKPTVIMCNELAISSSDMSKERFQSSYGTSKDHQNELSKEVASLRSELKSVKEERDAANSRLEEARKYMPQLLQVQRYNSKWEIDCHGAYVRYDSVEYGLEKLLSRLSTSRSTENKT